MKTSKPSLLLTTLIMAAIAITWGLLRLVIFPESVVPLSYVIPLLICVWTMRRWQLWTMTAVFCAMAAAKSGIVVPASTGKAPDILYMFMTMVNIVVGGAVVHAIIRLRENLEKQNSLISSQNSELEAQAEELSQQNEEMRAQAEELAGQNEEIERQSEEFANQNEELLETNQRLAKRESILQSFLQASRDRESVYAALKAMCERTLATLDEPAQAVAILEREAGGYLAVRATAGGLLDTLPTRFSADGSLPGLVLKEQRTAYVSDLEQRQDLAAPFGARPGVRSLLATPFHLEKGGSGVLLACGAAPAHWTEEQFRVIEWVAAQCSLLVDTLRWQKELAERAEEVEAANQAKDRFLAMLSHELRTPLTPVLAAAGALENDPRLPEEARADLHMICRNIGIQSRLIDDLLDLTRISRGKIQVESQVVGLTRLLRDTARIVAADLDARNQTLVLGGEDMGSAAVSGDGARLQQVFWNLLKNAIKFSPTGGRINLDAWILPNAPAPRLAVEVVDRGVGIAPENLERIFLPFEQATEGPRHATDQGLGLGLAIAKAIVEIHGGTISVRSAGLGQGAVFRVELPLSPDPAPTLPRPAQPGAGPATLDGAVPRILLVEDHLDTGLILSRLLKRAGYDVHHASSAGEGFQAFQDGNFDILVSDLGLPDESGIMLMQRIARLRPDLPAICLSGFGMEDDMQACYDAGFTEHLTKPVELAALQAAIGRILRR
jgi:signal transduction histidine kinase